MKRRKNPETEVAAWNAKVGVGDTVEYRGYPEAEPQTFTTRTPAEVLSGHTAVVWLNGKAGCVCVDACRKVVRHNVQIEPTARLFAQVGSNAGLGVAVPPAPTFEKGKKE